MGNAVSYPAEPMGSLDWSIIGIITLSISSCVYPNSESLLSRSSTSRPTTLPDDTSSMFRRFLSSQSLYGYADESDDLISSSRSILPSVVSIMIIFPGFRRPDSLTSDSGNWITPVSEANMNMPSSVITYLAGRSPFLSSIPPAYLPSVNNIAAGPSHGSMRIELYS